MVMKQIAPYGDWQSPITADWIVSQTRSFAAPRACRRTGKAYFTEAQDGRRTIVQLDDSGSLKDVLPAEFSVQNAIYKYGASLYDVLPDGRLIFSNQDNSVCVLDPDSGHVSLLVQSGDVLRYGGFSANAQTPLVLGIEEDHTHPEPRGVKNHIVAINALTGEVKRIVSGADFYYLPQSTADGSRICWLEWDHPDLVFDSCKLVTADWEAEDGSVRNVRLVAGSNKESVAEPRWGLDGSLFFAQEVNGFRQLFQIPPGGSHAPTQIKLKGLETSEIGEVSFAEGSRTYVPVTERFLAVTATSYGTRRLLVVDLETGSWREAVDGDTINHLWWDAIARVDESSVLVIGSSSSVPVAVHKINIHRPELNSVIRRSVDDDVFPRDLISKPQLMCISSKGFPSHTIYGFLWLPKNPKYQPEEHAPFPLVIFSHGGPTAHVGPGLAFRIQYFTSRGYAYFALNYTGSTGYGKGYRDALFGDWGVVDAADAADAADFFVFAGLARAGSVGITGGSAGGYNTLQCLTRHPKTFAGGVCAAGISDVKRLDQTTHKLESDYVAALVFPDGATDKAKETLYHERSALYHADKIEAPLLLIHGQADTVVPIEQARSIANSLKQNGGDVRIVEVEGEGHMLGKPPSAKLYIEEEEKWWRKTLLGKKDNNEA